jgi:hypothetical protein
MPYKGLTTQCYKTRALFAIFRTQLTLPKHDHFCTFTHTAYIT